MSLEFARELIVLGLNQIILSVYVRQYLDHKKAIAALKAADQYKIDANLVSHVAAQKDQKLGYAIIRGTVKPIGPPIRAAHSPSVTGVLQVINLSEHRAARGLFGMWVEQTKLIHTSANEVPFGITNECDAVTVEVIDALSAAMLDLDVVYDNYEPVSNSFFDNLFGFFLGVRQQGLQTTEEVLRDGSFITACGELELDGGQLRLQPSSAGPMMLTTATKNTIVRRLEDAKSSTMFRIFVFGSIGVLLAGYIGRKLYLRRRKLIEEQELRDALERSRKARREMARNQSNGGGQGENQSNGVCVVCVVNPKEVICLPCGHVCLCETCATQITERCPVCRTRIERKAAAFIT